MLLTVCFSSASFQLLDSVQNVKEAVGEFPAASLPPPLPPYPEIGDLSLSGRTNFQLLIKFLQWARRNILMRMEAVSMQRAFLNVFAICSKLGTKRKKKRSPQNEGRTDVKGFS